MEQLRTYILEKLRITKNSAEFTWNEFIDTLYKYEDGAFWLQDLPNISGFDDLPEFEHEGKLVKAEALVMYDFNLENKSIDVLYSLNEASARNAMTIHDLNELNTIIDSELITEIYDIISK